MKQRGIKLVACAIAGAVLLSGMGMNASATGVAAVLPVAGLALTLEEGISVNVMKKENEQAKAPKYKAQTRLVNDKNTDTSNISLPSSVTEIVSVSEDTLKLTSVSENEVPNAAETPIIPEVKKPIEKLTETETEEETTEEEATEEITTEEEATEEETTEEESTESEDEYFSTLVIAKVNDYVNVRSMPSEEGEILGKLYDKSVGEFVEEEDGWYKITSGSVTGYVKAEFVVTGEDAIALAKEVGHRLATVNTVTLFVREEPTVESTNLGMVPIEDELTVLEELDGWVKVSIEEGEGYVSADYVTLSTEFVKAESKAEEKARKEKEEKERKAARAAAAAKVSQQNNQAPAQASQDVPVASGGSDIGNAVANYALQFVGNPYVYGGTSLTNGTDCSGFTMGVYQNFGVSLPHSSGAQRGRGYDVGGLANAQPGDIVCYSGHVGIYIGNGNIVHASTAKTGIKVSNASYRKVLSVRRIF